MGNVPLDRPPIEELMGTGKFTELALDVDEAEHSIEMQLPFLVHAMFAPTPHRLIFLFAFRRNNVKFTVVPVMVGQLTRAQQKSFGDVFAGYVDDVQNFFLISSDFCHYGNRFRYTPAFDISPHLGIESLDREAMKLIEAKDVEAFNRYLNETKNTICGCWPICVFLESIKKSPYHLTFLHYAQSNPATSARDSSVSYASAVLR